LHIALCAAVVLGFVSLAQAEIITGVDRTNASSGDRTPIGVFEGAKDTLPNQAGGLTQDNVYFSDRDYTINVVPTLLEGAEYVRTFNTDKDGGGANVNYAVTTGEMANLYVLVDDRLSDQQAAVDTIVAAFASAGGFTDTGIDLTINENNGPTQSVYGASAAYAAGTYDFGAQADHNFYSIVATPAPVPEPSTLVLAVLALAGLAVVVRRR